MVDAGTYVRLGRSINQAEILRSEVETLQAGAVEGDHYASLGNLLNRVLQWADTNSLEMTAVNQDDDSERSIVAGLLAFLNASIEALEQARREQ